MSQTVSISKFGNIIISLDSANMIADEIEKYLKNDCTVCIDFCDVIMLTTQCANAIISRIYRCTGNKIREKVDFVNMTENLKYIISDTLRFVLSRESSV